MFDKSDVTSAYIHIPFCKSKCRYCSFVSDVCLDKKTGYLYSLLKEIEGYKGEKLNTLYIGGGTPSVLGINELEKIVKNFDFSDDAEITIELNPNDITKEYMIGLKTLGFNRVSIGAQTFDEDILKIIGRRHSKDEIYKAVETANMSGFENISLDFIYGLPTQTIKGFEKDLNEALNLDIKHISLYGLKIDEGCYFYDNRPKDIPTEDEQADMYIMAGELTKSAGFNHYEISNYSKTGYESRHNINYWRCGQYYGFGVSAHGYVDGVRYCNVSDIEEYLKNPTEHEYGKFMTKQEMLEERIFLGFRLSDGIDRYKINEEFGINFDEKYNVILDKYINIGYIEETEFGYRLSDDNKTNGFLLSNIILSEFID